MSDDENCIECVEACNCKSKISLSNLTFQVVLGDLKKSANEVKNIQQQL